jgi:hypothetical protein
MNPLLDQILVALLVLGALGFFVRRYLRRKSGACGSDCCGTKAAPLIKK